MRLLPALLVASLLAVALAPAPAAAQDVEAPVLLLEDKRGDVAADASGTPTTLPPGTWDAMDLVSLSVQEAPNQFLFTLETVSLAATAQQAILTSVQYQVVFRHQDQVYKIQAYVYGDANAYGSLQRMPAGVDIDNDYGDYVADVPTTVDLATNALTFEVARDHLTDGQGATPYPGRALDLFSVDAGILNGGNIMVMGQSTPVPFIEDRMPETGSGELPLQVRFGIVQTGDLRLSSVEPFRASNGEATTFVFRVNATNVGNDEQVAEFVAVGAPAAWDIRLPGLLRLQANQSIEVPIIVRTAFMHTHGTATAFTLELAGQDGASTGRIQMGLRYPKIAQPAGHHNQVFLHNFDESADPLRSATGLVNKGLGGYDYLRWPYFNTAEGKEDPQDAATAVSGQTCETLRIQEDNDTIGTTYCWYVPLSPALEMGLDFDLASLGTYTVPIHSLSPQPGARVQGTLVHYAPSQAPDDPFMSFFYEPTVVATLLPSDRVDIGLDGKQTFTGVIRPEPDGDYLPYERGAHLELRLEVRTDRPDNFFLGPRAEPELLPGASMLLPLLEYEDPVDEAFGVANTLHLALDGEGHRLANPGDTVVYTVTLHNAGAEAHDLAATLVGSNREWGAIVGADAFEVAADGSRVLTVAVTVPAEARDEDRADLVLEVASQDDVATRALVRLVTTADTDAEHEDQAGLLAAATAPKDTPATPLAFLALALLGLALRRR